MHSAEHILNQTMVRILGCGRCFSAHINPKKSKCDYKFTRDLTEAEASEIESMVNRTISRNLDVTEEFVSREAAQSEFNLKRLPEGAGDDIRIVRIGDYDACPCIGSHVDNTQEIGTFVLGSHSFEDGVLRLRFKLKK